MPEMDLDKLLKFAADPEMKGNMNSILDILKEINSVLKEADNILDFMKKVEESLIVSIPLKIKAKAAGIDLTPLSAMRGDNLLPSSEIHKTVMENINKLNQEQLKGLLEAIQRYDKEIQPNPKT